MDSPVYFIAHPEIKGKIEHAATICQMLCTRTCNNILSCRIMVMVALVMMVTNLWSTYCNTDNAAKKGQNSHHSIGCNQ